MQIAASCGNFCCYCMNIPLLGHTESEEGIIMVKGVSRQVIVVHAPDRKLFEQAIFILREDAPQQGITDEMLLREACQVTRNRKKQPSVAPGPVWALGGALVTALIWFLSTLI